ncbi:pyridoxamine 5'-phosphate oxidase family protein [Mesonia sp. MT50]|uniref:Pyridoxamine 5'-phosphate oxidase family protein n=1 Tax=Mesonia profundi TaxID=3070998 RepID=A0ABU1A352_9FLAO|nr:pyridoxamine 5'-phosphate oxidase family protein [Mesonia profundi]MDQ7918117.1 pyridoxamine 5'-phosphate oxidase family protein [Mesonia profundi]
MSTKNKKNEKALEKLKEMTNSIETSILVTNLGKAPLKAIPMTQKKIDDHGNIWFLSSGDSDHNKNITQNSKSQLLYSSPADKKFVSVYGDARIITDQSILEDLYSNVSDNWFNGVDDPNLTAIKFQPKEAYYWDTKTNKYISFLKMGVASLTGNEQDIGEKGKLNL